MSQKAVQGQTSILNDVIQDVAQVPDVPRVAQAAEKPVLTSGAVLPTEVTCGQGVAQAGEIMGDLEAPCSLQKFKARRKCYTFHHVRRQVPVQRFKARRKCYTFHRVRRQVPVQRFKERHKCYTFRRVRSQVPVQSFKARRKIHIFHCVFSQMLVQRPQTDPMPEATRRGECRVTEWTRRKVIGGFVSCQWPPNVAGVAPS